MTKKLKLQKSTTIAFLALLVLLLLNPFVVIDAGQRGVLMKFGQVQERVMGEGLHVVIPIIDRVEKLSVRIQKHEISAEASSKDLQEVFTDVALNWHILAEKANTIFQTLGTERDVVERIINPTIEEVVKAVMAKYTAEEIITKRGEVKGGVDELLTGRLENYWIKVDDISLVHVYFSQRFSEAVEAKQIAEQEAKKTVFFVQKALQEAEAKVNFARGDAEAQRLLRENLTIEILIKQAIEKWDGKLPVVLSPDNLKTILDIHQFLTPNSLPNQ